MVKTTKAWLFVSIVRQAKASPPPFVILPDIKKQGEALFLNSSRPPPPSSLRPIKLLMQCLRALALRRGSEAQVAVGFNSF
jgi:hypothetical protein